MEQRFHIDNKHIHDPLLFGDILLYQVGRLYIRDRKHEVSGAHFHGDWFELTIVTAGKGEVTTNHTSSPIESGQIYLSFPYETHQITATDSSFKYDFVAFHTADQTLHKELEDLHCLFNQPDVRLFQDEKICQLVNNCILEFCNSNPHREEILHANLTLIIHYLLRDFSERSPYDKSRFTKNEVLCLQIMNYIDSHLHSLKSLYEVAEEFNYNYTYLSGLFKKVTKTSLSDYYSDKKLNLAKQLIIESRLKISEVAAELNYANPYAFSKAFKNHFGISPKHMQLQLK